MLRIISSSSSSFAAASAGARLSLPSTSMMIRRAYHEKVLDHYSKPRNVGSLNKSDLNVGTGLVGAPACGDVMKLQIRVDDDGRIVEAKFKTFGCGSAIASSSFATEKIKGMTLAEAASVKNTDIAKELCLPPVKLHCSMLAEDAIKSAINDFQRKRSKASSSTVAAAAAAASSSAAASAGAAMQA